MGNKIPQVIFAMVWLIASLLFIYHTSSMMVTISENIDDGLFQGMYWITIAVMFMLIGIALPITLVIDAYRPQLE